MEELLHSRLAESPLAARIAQRGRVVLRRFAMSLVDYAEAVRDGRITLTAPRGEPPVCELEYGGQIIASGSIEERDGTVWFVPEEESNG